MIIDFHAHTFPDHIAAAAVDKLKHNANVTPYSDGTAAGLARKARAAGVDYTVVANVATNPAKVSSMNDRFIRANGQDGLLYFGCMHPDMPDMRAELARIAAAGIKGIKLHHIYQGVDVDDPRSLRVLDRAAELGLIVLMHGGLDIGFPGMVRSSPEMTANALRQVGAVKLVCAHMGGWRSWDAVADSLGPTGAMIDTSFSLGDMVPYDPARMPGADTHMLGDAQFLSLVRAFGADRVLFGTDSPWGDQQENLDRLRALPLEDDEKQAILGGNAGRLLGL